MLRSMLIGANSIAAPSRAIFASSAFPYEVSQSDETVGRWMIAAIVPDAISAITETNATREKRGTQTESPGMRRSLPNPAPAAISPIRPPTQSEPEATWIQSSATETPRGDVSAA